MSRAGLGPLIYYSGRMNSLRYIQILTQHLEKAADFMGIPNLIILHDRASWHTSGLTRNFMEKKEWGVIECPPNSPVIY